LELENWSFLGLWILGFGAFIGNQKASTRVIIVSVDTISTTTWLISTLLSWFRLPYGTMKKRLANWCAVSIRWSRKWSGRIERDELVKRIFAK
jgi:hypothetical protein